MNFIEELFYGNLQPNVRRFSEDSAYGKAISTIAQCEQILTDKLDSDLKAQFLTLVNTQAELTGITAYESFLDGFLLGAGFMRDTFLVKPDRDFRNL